MPNYEVEMKFPHPNLAAFEEYLLKLQPQEIGPAILETDSYFDRPGVPARDDQGAMGELRGKDEWLRIRQWGTGSQVLTYKGPLVDEETKTRVEIQSPIESGRELLRYLGFMEILQVKKYRRRAHFVHDDLHVNVLLDDVWSLGSFVELEIPDVPAAQKDNAVEALKSVAEKLQLHDPENSGYAILLLEQMEQS